MAKIMFTGAEDFGERLRKMEAADSAAMIQRAVVKGAAPVADAIRRNINAMPEQKPIHLAKGKKLHAPQEHEKKDLQDSFGVTPVRADRRGFIHVKAGFDGYGSVPTKKYPKGVPNQLVAASIERGSSVRNKWPFIRPAVNKTRQAAVDAMDESIQKDVGEVFEK